MATPKEPKSKKKKYRWLRRSLRVFFGVLFLFFLLIGAVIIAIQMPPVQSRIADYAIEQLNQEFNSKLSVDSVDVDFWGDINLYGVKSKDQKDSTFIDIKRVKLSLDLWKLIKDQENINLDYVKLFEPTVRVITYPGEETSNFIWMIDSFDDGKESKGSKFKMEGNFDIENGTLSILNLNLPKDEQVWLDSKNFNASIKDFLYYKKDISAKMESLNFVAKKNGEDYTLKNFTTDFVYSNNQMQFNTLDLETQDSHLIGHVSFLYNDIKQFTEFSDSVQWDMDLQEGSKVSYKDIRYWTDGWEKEKTVNLTGKVTGVLTDMNIQDLRLDADGNQIIANTLNLKNVTNLDDLQVFGNGLNINTSYQNLTNLLPQDLSNQIDPFVKRLGNVKYKGDFTYQSNLIDVNGTTDTNLGNAKLNGELRNFDSADKLVYSGLFETKSFDLKTLTGSDELGFVAGKVNFSGQGTDIESLVIKADGKVDFIDLLGKRYNNISLDGTLQNQRFNGFASIRDSKLNLDYSGILDFSETPYYLEFDSEITYLDLDDLGVTNNRSVLKGVATGTLLFNSADDFTGEVDLENILYKNFKNQLSIDKAFVISENNGDAKRLYVEVPDYMDAEVNGNFVLTELPDAILNSFQDLIVDYKPKEVSENQNFDFEINIKQDLISQFYPEIKIEPNTVLTGNIDTNTNEIISQLSTPGLNYSGLDFIATTVDINTTREENPVIILSEIVNIEGIPLKDVRIYGTPVDDNLKINAKFLTGNENPIQYDLNLMQQVNAEGYMELRFEPSVVRINQTDWLVNPNNDFYENKAILNFDENSYKVETITLQSGDQKVSFSGDYNEEGYDFSADLINIVLSNIIPQEVLGDTQLDGIANGKVEVIKTENSLKPTADLAISEIVLNSYPLGTLTTNAEYDTTENIVNIEAFLQDGEIQTLFLTGFIDNKPEKPELNFDANFDDFNLAFLGGFLTGVLSNVRGTGSGNMHFEGPLNGPDIDGVMKTNEFGFTVDYLNVDYVFKGEQEIPIFKYGNGQGTIQLNNLEFTDTRFNTVGTATGGLFFRELSNWFFNLSFLTNNLLVLNTTERNNELFYGRVFADGRFHFEGSPSEINFEAGGDDGFGGIETVEILENSEFTINTGSYFVDSETSLVRFVPNQNIEAGTESTDRPVGITMGMNLEVNENSVVNLIFDSATNDKLFARGKSENLEIKMNRKGDLTMNGVYEVVSGAYEFRKFPVPKDFIIKKGGTIKWTNSPYDADLNITAVYPKLVSNVDEYLGIGFAPALDVNLNIILKETLEKPFIEWDIEVPQASSSIQTQLATRLNASPDEILQQFGFILITGQFGVSDTNIFNSGDVIARQAAADIALRQLSNLFSAIAKEVQIDFDYITGDEFSQTSDRLGARLNLAVDPRWTIKGTGGVPLNNIYNENLTLELEAEYDASENIDKSFVITGFSRPTTFGVENLNSSSAATQSYGVGVSWSKSFNRLRDIFKSRERIQEEQEQLEKLRKEQFGKNQEKADSSSISNKMIQNLEQKDSLQIAHQLEEKKSNQNKKKKKKKPLSNQSLVRFK